jgi:hypothetical protein
LVVGRHDHAGFRFYPNDAIDALPAAGAAKTTDIVGQIAKGEARRRRATAGAIEFASATRHCGYDCK